MENLDQIRAQHACKEGRSLDKAYVDRLPSMIVNNGLLAAAAFAATDNQREKLGKVMQAVARYLRLRGLLKSPGDSAESLCSDLSSDTSEKLRMATDETLAYLSFLKRFAQKKGE